MLREAPLQAVCALADAPESLGSAYRRQGEFEHAIAQLKKDHPEVAVQPHIAAGSARAALLEAAHNAQLLVVGSRGMGGVPGMMLGSVSLAMLHHAPCPVGVIHPR